MFLMVASPAGDGHARWNTALHVLLTFHFTVLSRVFFRADDLDTSRKMIAGLLRFDAHGIREGLITPGVWAVLLVRDRLPPADAEGPDRPRDVRGVPPPAGAADRAAGRALGLAIHLLLSSGPRANIYFQF